MVAGNASMLPDIVLKVCDVAKNLPYIDSMLQEFASMVGDIVSTLSNIASTLPDNNRIVEIMAISLSFSHTSFCILPMLYKISLQNMSHRLYLHDLVHTAELCSLALQENMALPRHIETVLDNELLS